MKMPFKNIIVFSIAGVIAVAVKLELTSNLEPKVRFYAYPLLVFLNLVAVFKSNLDNIEISPKVEEPSVQK